MNRLEILPFEDEHLEGAARLLAERHARHREAEPLLPADVDFAGEIEKERDDDLRGAVALDGDEVVGYLVGKRREDAVGAHVWSYVAGHAVREPELTRDLYAAAAAGWVDAGLTRHFAYVPNLPDLVDPWFRLSFGGSSALGTRETSPRPAVAGVDVRESTPDDVAAAAMLDRLMAESMLPSPSFSYHEPDDEETVTEEWSDTWDHPETYRHFVAERDGRVVGHILLYRRPPDLRVPADSIDLAAASTPPEERGSGIGVALTHHVLTWAYEQGIPTMVTDWRLSNLLASRFWPKRGFRPTFFRMYRSIP